MPEAGGPTTQSGIFYQNSVTALYLGRLLDLRRFHGVQARIVEVRAEAPVDVDDIVITYADGSTLHIQAKEKLTTSGDAWAKLWAAVARQTSRFAHSRDTIHIVVGTLTGAMEELREAFARAKGARDDADWRRSLSGEQTKVLRTVSEALPDGEATLFEIAQRTEFCLWTLAHIQDFLARDWLPASNVKTATLYSHLRDVCGGNARIRKAFSASDLSEHLLHVHKVRLTGSPADGLEKYRKAIILEMGHVTVPGTAIAASESDLLVMPSIYALPSSRQPDFEDEESVAPRHLNSPEFDLRHFPAEDFRTIVLESGAGGGKTTLLRATARRLAAESSYVPAMITAEALQGHLSVADYLTVVSNAHYDVRVDWEALAESGRLVILIDGIDEVSDSARAEMLKTIGRTAARFPQTPMLIGARDAAITSLPPSFKRYRIRSMGREQQFAMLTAYLKQRDDLDSAVILRKIRRHSELFSLWASPLLVAIFVATLQPGKEIISSRRELLEQYLELALAPGRHKQTGAIPCSVSQLRRGAQALALLALERNENAVPTQDARLRLSTVLPGLEDESLVALSRCGIIQRRGARTAFVIPTVHEYLAGIELAQPGALTDRDWHQSVYRRPWGQAVQYAVEQLEDAEPLIERWLGEPDDIYVTSLRLIGRCILNGANVGERVRSEVANRLVQALSFAPWGTRYKLAQIISDGFYRPAVPALREWLCKPANEIERAAILIRIADPQLIRAAFDATLERDDLREYWNRDWQTLVRTHSSYMISRLLQRARDEALGSLNSSVIAKLLYELRGEPSIDWPAIAEDETLPSIIRIAAQFSSAVVGGIDFALLDQAARENSKHALWINFVEAIVTVPGWESHVQRLCRSRKADVLQNLFPLLSGDHLSKDVVDKVASLLGNISDDPDINPEVASWISVSLACLNYPGMASRTLASLPTASKSAMFEWVYSCAFLPDEVVVEGVKILAAHEQGIDDAIEMIKALASEVGNVPDGPARGFFLTGRSFRRREMPSGAVGAIEAWADALSPHASGFFAKASLLEVKMRIDMSRDLSEVVAFLDSYLSSVDRIAEDDWDAFASLFFLLDESRKRVDPAFLWRVIQKGGDLPLSSVMERIIRQEQEACYPAVIDYWANGTSASARYGIIRYFEDNAPRLGLILTKEGKILKIEKA
ncbi:NACHT domain-containing protein [Rhizobium phaseoli]|uniref:NACHT domain-containing protein n=1 Tax=Rhizobium phaseoli TaxID=396 RepID=UPI0007EB96A8|nr:NACHT domain-containing protein [Rhizobium phaseoli]